jgi:hypothetical protein
MQLERRTYRQQPMDHGHHGRDPDPAGNQHMVWCVFVQGKVVPRLRNSQDATGMHDLVNSL